MNRLTYPTDEQLRQLDIYRSRTSDRGLSSLNIITSSENPGEIVPVDFKIKYQLVQAVVLLFIN